MAAWISNAPKICFIAFAPAVFLQKEAWEGNYSAGVIFLRKKTFSKALKKNVSSNQERASLERWISKQWKLEPLQ